MTQITKLPLIGEDRKAFVEIANAMFAEVLERLDIADTAAAWRLFDAERYIDKEFFTDLPLPIDREYALSMVTAFGPSYVIDLLEQAEIEPMQWDPETETLVPPKPRTMH